jgi:hypothetical protein
MVAVAIELTTMEALAESPSRNRASGFVLDGPLLRQVMDASSSMTIFIAVKADCSG